MITFEDLRKNKESKPFYLPESGACMFCRMLERDGRSYRFIPYGIMDEEERESLPEFELPPFGLGIRVSRLSKLETQFEPEDLAEKYYDMLEDKDYLEWEDDASAQAREDGKDFGQPGIWQLKK